MGAKALGWSMHTAVRNVDPDTYDPVAAGYTQFGDPTGSSAAPGRAMSVSAGIQLT